MKMDNMHQQCILFLIPTLLPNLICCQCIHVDLFCFYCRFCILVMSILCLIGIFLIFRIVSDFLGFGC